MQTMKLSEVLANFDGKTFVFGGKTAGRKNPKKELVTVRAELHPRGIVKLVTEGGTEVLHSRIGVEVFAAPVGDSPASTEEKSKAPRKKAVKAPRKAAEKAREVPAEKAEEKPAKRPGKAPANFVDLARSANTEAARRYWAKVVAEYEG